MAKPAKKPMTRKEKSAANRAAYADVRSKMKRDYVPKKAEKALAAAEKRKAARQKSAKAHASTSKIPMQRERGDVDDTTIITEILDLIAEGSTIARALKALGLSRTQWLAWVTTDKDDLKSRQHSAFIMQAEAWADEIIAEADAATWATVNVARLRIETKKWLMGKNSHRFSDKSTVTLEGGDNPITMIRKDMTEEEMLAAYAETVKKVDR